MVRKQTVDRGRLIKFYVPFKRLLKEDKVTISSGLMKQFLMRAEAYLWPLAIFISTIKKPQESLYPNRSGTPKDDQDSSLVHCILGVFFLISFQNLDSGFIVH